MPGGWGTYTMKGSMPNALREMNMVQVGQEQACQELRWTFCRSDTALELSTSEVGRGAE